MNDAANSPVPEDPIAKADASPAAGAKPSDDKADASSKIQKVMDATTSFLGLAFREWLPALLMDPKNPPFKYQAPLAGQVDRLARLITVVCILSGIVVGGSLFLPSVTPWELIATAVGLLIRVFIVAVIYKPVTYVFGIRMPKTKTPLTLQQLFFIACYSLLPWTPILTALWTASAVAEGTTDIVVIFIYIVCIGWICHVAAGLIGVLTKVSMIRAWICIATPVISYLLLQFLYPLLF